MKNKIEKIKATCNMCHKQMEGILELEKYTIPVCVNLKCPNFGLLQISEEKIIEFLDKEKLRKIEKNEM